ncbi:ATP-binding protein [Calditerrivibrio nitroreducens]|uniref:histidine kinase n=1 Tax=Calditerrivibrio nitroreducens (strain DSM 19672 / NBRC 101217 / Yu37-1) TaxID=768670 RepID=E4TFY5_CALNY|nr:ATP-binding protein [Calditerrivibrio nitroreducens]ADR19641.1 multi-sensor hybrid histidine kinase [Calditerrivibrio nitroreducens DSM 19672]
MRKKVVLYIIFFLIFNFSFYLIILHTAEKELNHHNNNLSGKFLMEYNTIVKDFYNLTDFIVNAYIYEKPEILDKLYDAVIENKKTDEKRNEIYSILLPIFQKIQLKGYSQIHIIDHRGFSFLRLHLPAIHSDDLKPFRSLIVKAINEKRKIIGMEVGRHEIAYRAIYPIFHKGVFLGLLDFALNYDFILDYMNKELNGEYYYIIQSSSLKSMKDEYLKRQYKKLSPDGNFYIRTESPKFNNNDIIKILNNISLLSPQNKVYNLPNNLSMILLPIYTFDNNFLGYAIKVEKDTFLSTNKRFRIIITILFSLLSFTVVIFFIIIDRKNEILKKELIENEQNSKKLSEINRLYDIILENSNQIAYDYNMNTGKVKRSGAIEKMLGISSKRFQETDVTDFVARIHPEDRAKTYSLIKLYQEDNIKFDVKYRLRKDDGTYLFISDQGVYITIDGEKHIIGTMKDITPIIKYEEAVQNAQRIESIGILAGGIAHDFNNILAGIRNYIELIRITKNLDILDSFMEKTLNALDRAKALANQLLTFSKGGDPLIKVVDIKNIINTVATFSLTGSSVKLNIDIEDDLLNCFADEHQISQVIENLVINARQAMSDKGELFIKAENYKHHKDVNSNLLIPEGDYIKISIKDTGHGIPEDHLKKIFEPFFTTKKKGKGLGLAICYNIVKKHNGDIEIISELNKGTTVVIYLPATDKKVDQNVSDTKSIDADSNLKIILMDDEDLILDSTSMMLEFLGYTVYQCKKGEEVLQKYRELKNNGINIDIFILDITIVGGMGGLDTIQELLKIDKNIKAIVSSGYSDDPVFSQYENYGFFSALKKPYGLDDLSKAIKECF